MNLPTSLDLLLRRVQDRFAMTPLFQTKRVPEISGTTYIYVTKIAPPRLTFDQAEYSRKLNGSRAATAYIDTVTEVLTYFITNERKRKKRSSKAETSRAKRQSNPERELVAQQVRLAFEFEWELAKLLPDKKSDWMEMLAESLSVRTFQNQVPALSWSLLTDLSIIDPIQVVDKNYFLDMNELLESTSENILKLYVYIRALVSMFPYLPAVFRQKLDDALTMKTEPYTKLDCSSVTFTLTYEEAMTLTLAKEEELFNSERQFAVAVAYSAKGDLQRAFGSYRGIDSQTKSIVLSELAALSVRQAPMTVEGTAHSATSLPLTPTPTFLDVARAIIAHKSLQRRQASFAATQQLPYGGFDLRPLLDPSSSEILLPVGFIHLTTWLQEAEFLLPFYKSLLLREVLTYLIARYMYSSSFHELNKCALQNFPAFENYTVEHDPVANSVFVELAIQSLIFKGSIVTAIDAVGMGSNYFYERQLNYMAYAQPMCLSSESEDMTSWWGSVRPSVLLQGTFRRSYNSRRSFDCGIRGSCFFWATVLDVGLEEGGVQ